MIRYSNGVNTHNLFNIKADGRWDGPRAVVPTLEYNRGRPVSEYAAFRSYPNFEASFADYVDFLKRSPRYQQALGNASDSAAFVEALPADATVSCDAVPAAAILTATLPGPLGV